MNKFFIEIGSSDFDTLLPLAENGWSGVIVEPVKELLDNLDVHDNVIYESCAISDVDGISTIKFCDPLRIPDTQSWMRGLGNITGWNHFWKDSWASGIMMERDVTVMRLDTLITKHNISKIDYMKIDIEGSEWIILKDYSWSIKPTMLKVETEHWKPQEELAKEEIFSVIERILTYNDYIVYYEKSDLYAIR